MENFSKETTASWNPDFLWLLPPYFWVSLFYLQASRMDILANHTFPQSQRKYNYLS
jgi:hypothetical protein